jgi:hypothetical protein
MTGDRTSEIAAEPSTVDRSRGSIDRRDPSYRPGTVTICSPRERALADRADRLCRADRLFRHGTAHAGVEEDGAHIDTTNYFGSNGRADVDIGSRTWNVGGAEKHPPIVACGSRMT